jgi:hypothetical protein
MGSLAARLARFVLMVNERRQSGILLRQSIRLIPWNTPRPNDSASNRSERSRPNGSIPVCRERRTATRSRPLAVAPVHWGLTAYPVTVSSLNRTSIVEMLHTDDLVSFVSPQSST